MMLKKTLIAASLAAMSLAALSEEAALPATDEITATANVSLVSEYRFRGIAQTFGQPAIQGGFDIGLPMGFYVGNWNSNVASGAGYPGGNLEMDFYGGWKGTFADDWGVDTGVLAYLYPGSKGFGTSGSENADGAFYAGTKSGMINNIEYYIGGSWKTVSLKQSIAFTDYFGMTGGNNASTAGSGYTDLSATYDLGQLDDKLAGWGLIGHLGYLYVRNYSAANYMDWKFGISKDLGGGWSASASYIQTNANGNCGNFSTSTQPYCLTKTWDTNGATSGGPRNLGNATGVATITKTF